MYVAQTMNVVQFAALLQKTYISTFACGCGVPAI